MKAPRRILLAIAMTTTIGGASLLGLAATASATPAVVRCGGPCPTIPTTIATTTTKATYVTTTAPSTTIATTTTAEQTTTTLPQVTTTVGLTCGLCAGQFGTTTTAAATTTAAPTTTVAVTSPPVSDTTAVDQTLPAETTVAAVPEAPTGELPHTGSGFAVPLAIAAAAILFIGCGLVLAGKVR